ncbi:MAG: hypothetical protein DWH94_03545 [Planctomycetota bacterium]|nr:MAG: hypothetical protein DWH80_03750 [Planctomycetota bacterium]RLS59832.1 MAG: hypothetical protein DWH94_03545 [Planctomycetota bacterium]TSA08135.1 MAG: hypothetical protein D4R77_03320 [Planctomycetaceae bacterium]
MWETFEWKEKLLKSRVLVDFVVHKIEFLLVDCLAAKIGLYFYDRKYGENMMTCMSSNRG